MKPQTPNPNTLLDDFCNRLQQLLENSPLTGIRATCKDSRENIRTIGEAMLSQMNVVSRADFDAQHAVLVKTAERLTQLEEKIAQLEEQKTTAAQSD